MSTAGPVGHKLETVGGEWTWIEGRALLEASLKKSGNAVWCDVVWCGIVWCGVVWCGVVRCAVVWCGGEVWSVVVKSIVVRCSVVWCGVVWCGVHKHCKSHYSDRACPPKQAHLARGTGAGPKVKISLE